MRSPLSRLRLVSALALSLLAVLGADTASAKITTKKAIWGQLTVAGKSTVPQMERLGVGIYQMQLRWERVAPTQPADPKDPFDPAYVWPATIDTVIKTLEPAGIQVSLLVMGAPPWTNGGKPFNYPGANPKHFANFLTAAARRYPEVRRWMIWGEPNGFGTSFQPGLANSNFMGVIADEGKPLPKSKLAGPQLYARYVDAAYKALKRESRRNIVIGGNTWTAGAVRPLHWIRALKLPNGKPPRMDQYGHNPGSARKPNLKLKPEARGTADFSDMDTLIKGINKHLGRTPQGKRIKVFISEYTILTQHPINGIPYFVSEEEKAQWIKAAMKIVRKNKQIATLGMYKLVDAPHVPNSEHPHWGLLDDNGNEKPGFFAFMNG